MPGTLYIVGTPIGNLEDITYRAVRVLREVSLIAAEDTRVSGKMLQHFGIATRLVSYHRHSGPGREEQILLHLHKGHDVALISDAGMPGISDPGQPLISRCVKEEVPVVPIPGPSSVITALAVSSFNTDRFRFLGFLPRARKERRMAIRESLMQPDTCAAFEAPHRVADTLNDFVAISPDQMLLLARELTKKFEELRRGTARDLAASISEHTPRGEIVLVWPGNGLAVVENIETQAAIAVTLARRYRQEGSSARDASARAATETGVPRRHIYHELLQQD